jgi:uncharacterized phage-like protein YoqJ
MKTSCTACFSGYRPEKFPFPLEQACPEYIALRTHIRAAITQAAKAGYLNFLCGMAQGFDLLCAEEFLTLQAEGGEYTSLQLVAVLPFGGHTVSGSWTAVHKQTLEQASRVVTVTRACHPGAFSQRNRYLVDHSSRLICYYDGRKGGTAHTVHYASKRRVKIINLAESS